MCTTLPNSILIKTNGSQLSIFDRACKFMLIMQFESILRQSKRIGAKEWNWSPSKSQFSQAVRFVYEETEVKLYVSGWGLKNEKMSVSTRLQRTWEHKNWLWQIEWYLGLVCLYLWKNIEQDWHKAICCQKKAHTFSFEFHIASKNAENFVFSTYSFHQPTN